MGDILQLATRLVESLPEMPRGRVESVERSVGMLRNVVSILSARSAARISPAIGAHVTEIFSGAAVVENLVHTEEPTDLVFNTPVAAGGVDALADMIQNPADGGLVEHSNVVDLAAYRATKMDSPETIVHLGERSVADLTAAVAALHEAA